MIGLIIEGAVLVMVIGLIAKLYLDRTQSVYRIDNQELAIASAVLLLVVVPVTAWVGTKIAVSSQVTYNENWGGFELHARWQRIPCHRDGNMKHSYKGDPYQYVWYTDETEEVGTGKNRHTVHKRVRHEETRYHDIPYTSEEWTFTIDTTLGEYVIADRNLPDNPDNYRYRVLVPVYSSEFPASEIGTPGFWVAARDRLSRGDPGPVTARREYANYILASQNTILRRFNDSIGKYQTMGMLPAINRGIYNFYFADRVYFVGLQVPGDWQSAINRFDGALGTTLQGDLHLVIVDANKVTDPDNYAGALFAYWQSAAFGKDALSKNGIVVILGTKDGETVAWARASTGMPEGNEALLVDIQNNLKGAKLDPGSILGHPQATVVGDSVRIAHLDPQGALEKELWGAHRFTRVHMGKPGQPGNVGYSYLLREIEPTGWQRFWILFVTCLFSCVAWGICIVHGAPRYRSYRSRYY